MASGAPVSACPARRTPPESPSESEERPASPARRDFHLSETTELLSESTTDSGGADSNGEGGPRRRRRSAARGAGSPQESSGGDADSGAPVRVEAATLAGPTAPSESEAETERGDNRRDRRDQQGRDDRQQGRDQQQGRDRNQQRQNRNQGQGQN